MRTRLTLLCCAMFSLGPAADLLAQTADAIPSPPPVRLLTRYSFHLSTGALGATDRQFDWTADFGGDLDLVDFGAGRVNFLANYEVVLGNEFKSFDPNQGNYTLDVGVPFRIDGGDIGPVFHHISRHFGDRPKSFAIDWNTVGVRGRQVFALGKSTIAADAWLGKVIQHSYVDYTWEGSVGLETHLPMSPTSSVFLRGRLDLTGVNENAAGRSMQRGGRAEAALRVLGIGAAVELFCAFERRIDALPVIRESRDWAVVGLRLLSR